MYDSKINLQRRQFSIKSIHTNMNNKSPQLTRSKTFNKHRSLQGKNRKPMLPELRLWGEMRVQGKMISSRSNHISCIYQNQLFVHGGKNNQTNAYNDLYKIKLKFNDGDMLQQWQLVSDQGPYLKRHSGVLWNDQFVVYGGLDGKDQQNYHMYSYSFKDNQWTQIQQNNAIETVDSHSVVIKDDQMILFGGFNQKVGKYQNSIYSFDLNSNSWSCLFKEEENKSKQMPSPRSSSQIVCYQNQVYIFGGMNGNKKLNDFWEYCIQSGQFRQIESDGMPCERSGHRMQIYNDKLVLFGGIQTITMEKNDLHLYDFNRQSWSCICGDNNTPENEKHDHGVQNTIEFKVSGQIDIQQNSNKKKKYNPLNSQTGTNQSKKYIHSYHRKQQETNQSSQEKIPKTAIAEQKLKEKYQSKQMLLNLFEVNENQKQEFRTQTPLTEAMKNSIMLIKNQNQNQNQNQNSGKGNKNISIIEFDEKSPIDEIIDYYKQPCPRDGHSIDMIGDRLVMFGGDRHKMTFNDIYVLELSNLDRHIR